MKPDFEKMARDYLQLNTMDAYRYGGEDDAIPNLTLLLRLVWNDAIEAAIVTRKETWALPEEKKERAFNELKVGAE